MHSEPKIGYFKFALSEKTVGWLDIPVNDPFGDQILIPGKDVPELGHGLALGEPEPVLQEGSQVPSLTILGDDVAVIGRIVGLPQGDDVGVAKLLQQSYLAF